MADRFWRFHPGDEDPETLLDPERGSRPPWDTREYRPCEKCDSTGRTTHECESCSGGSPDPDCPACGGRVRFEGECPACEGAGRVENDSRRGVSVFPDVDALYRYMLAHDADLDGCTLVELEGEVSDERDFDADEGAVLIRPSRIVATHEVDQEKLARAREVVEREGLAADG